MEDLIGGIAAIISTICWLPQTLKTWRTRETKDLSLPANLLIFSSIALWLVYGLMLGAWPLIVANTIAILLVGAIVAAKLKFG
jgi:MtN3 and saliva related transmembrane protein